MAHLLFFLFEGSVILLLMHVFYTVFLAKLTFFGWNRLFLLCSLGLALVLPLVSFEIYVPQVAILGSEAYTFFLPEFELKAAESMSPTIILLYLAIIGYGLGFFWTAGRLITGIIQTLFLIKASETFQHESLIIAVNPKFPPSSFFNYILLPEYQEGNRGHQLIILHESVHASKYHTLDLLFMQSVKAVFWFHPLIRFFESNIHEVHEFQADTKVTQFHPKKEYAQLLFNLITTNKEQKFVNNFNQFQLKKRIIMMNTTKSKLIQKGRFLLALPLLGFMVFVFSCDKSIKNTFPDKMEIPIIIETDSSNNPKAEISKADDVFDVVEDSPEFPGGMEAWNEFLMNHLKYPEQARKSGIEGTVYVAFEIRTDGSVKNVELLRGIGGGCDEEAMRVIKESPNWIPGKQKSQTVNVRMRIPIKFKLGDDDVLAAKGL